MPKDRREKTQRPPDDEFRRRLKAGEYGPSHLPWYGMADSLLESLREQEKGHRAVGSERAREMVDEAGEADFRRGLAEAGKEAVLVNLLSGVYGPARGHTAQMAREFLEACRVAAEEQHRSDALAVAKEANRVAVAAFILAAIALALSLGLFL